MKGSLHRLIVWSSLVGITTLSCPAEESKDLVEQGKLVFEKSTCAGCHPGGGNVLDPGRPIKGTAFALRYKSNELLEKTIRTGFARSGMPPFGRERINDKEMKALVCYIRSLTPVKSKCASAVKSKCASASKTR